MAGPCTVPPEETEGGLAGAAVLLTLPLDQSGGVAIYREFIPFSWGTTRMRVDAAGGMHSSAGRAARRRGTAGSIG